MHNQFTLVKNFAQTQKPDGFINHKASITARRIHFPVYLIFPYTLFRIGKAFMIKGTTDLSTKMLTESEIRILPSRLDGTNNYFFDCTSSL